MIKDRTKKPIAILLTFLMIFSLIPVSAFADTVEVPDNDPEIVEEIIANAEEEVREVDEEMAYDATAPPEEVIADEVQEETLPNEEMEESLPEEVKEDEAPVEEPVKEEDPIAEPSEEAEAPVQEEEKEIETPSQTEAETYSDASKGVTNYVPLMKVFTPIDGSILAYPLTKIAVITYGFGPRTPFMTDSGNMSSSDHKGIDLAIAMGTPVIASEDGIVIRAEYFSGYGNCVDIDHGNGLVTRYAHMSEINVRVGEEVVRGQQVGLVGSTGNSAGPHLHFEVILNGVQVDPMPYLEEVKDRTIVFDLNYSYGTLWIKNGEEEVSILQGGDTGTYNFLDENGNAKEEIIPEDNHVYTIEVSGPFDKEDEILVDAVNAWGYDIPITAFDEEGNTVELERREDGYYAIPLIPTSEGKVVRVLAGNEFQRRRLLMAAKAVSGTGGMTLSDNVVLQFAKAVGFDVDAFLASPNAWAIVGNDVDGVYQTSEGKSWESNSLKYYRSIDGAMNMGSNSYDANDLWEGVRAWNGVPDDWDAYNAHLHKPANQGGGVQCAGLVNSFFAYIRKNLYDDIDWKTYYDAYNYGIANNSYMTTTGMASFNDVGSVMSGLTGMQSYEPSEGVEYYVTTCKKSEMNESDFIALLDSLAPGAVIQFGASDQDDPPDSTSGGWVAQQQKHVGVYIGKANGLHWMFHTDDFTDDDYNDSGYGTGLRARISAIEYYSVSFSQGSHADSHKGDLVITRAGGMLMDSEPNMDPIGVLLRKLDKTTGEDVGHVA